MNEKESHRQRADFKAASIVVAFGVLTCGLAAPAPLRAEATTFAVIGDYGSGSSLQVSVAELIKGWNPDFIATTGDNSYVSNYELTVGATYQEFLDAGRFFPSIGNHDWGYPEAYFSYFGLTEDDLYYDVVVGDIHLFMYDNNFGWGTTVDQVEQDDWLRDAVSRSTADWKFLVAHQPRPADSRRSNYVPEDIILSEGIDGYFAGHNHYYQRNKMTDSIPSFIVGNSGRSLYNSFPGPDEPEAFYNDNHGALKVVVDGANATFEFWSIANGGTLIDRYSVPQAPPVGSPGDYNHDGIVDVIDIDLQALAMQDLNPYISQFDENDDGSVDDIDRGIWVHTHKRTYFGDANLDGEFTNDDIVEVFIAGTYHDGIRGNSTWATGDWDADREFTDADLVLAFIDGGYDRGPRDQAHAVPEPTSAGLAILALVGLGVVRRRRTHRCSAHELTSER